MRQMNILIQIGNLLIVDPITANLEGMFGLLLVTLIPSFVHEYVYINTNVEGIGIIVYSVLIGSNNATRRDGAKEFHSPQH